MRLFVIGINFSCEIDEITVIGRDSRAIYAKQLIKLLLDEIHVKFLLDEIHVKFGQNDWWRCFDFIWPAKISLK